MSYGADLKDVLSSSWRLHWPDSQGRETGRPSRMQSTKFELVINLQDRQDAWPHRPPMLLALADEVIE